MIVVIKIIVLNGRHPKGVHVVPNAVHFKKFNTINSRQFDKFMHYIIRQFFGQVFD
jgi:hypothetical protein